MKNFFPPELYTYSKCYMLPESILLFTEQNETFKTDSVTTSFVTHSLDYDLSFNDI